MSEKKRLLIADDSRFNQQLLTEILSDSYEYLYANDGAQALALLGGQNRIDLVLLDINMPKLNGFQVLEVMNQRHWIEELPVVIISADDNDASIRRAYDLGVDDYIQRPFHDPVVQRRVENNLALYARQKHLAELAEEQVYQREKANNAIINILSHVVESKNHESGAHLLHVRTVTELLLRQIAKVTGRYRLTQADISMIVTVSALHDIGKIDIPEEILNKPGKLTPEEFEIMKRHTVIGDELLRDVPLPPGDPLLRTAHEICRWHHERYDGRGYPDGLRGEAIPISAQVVALADVYDALTSERCYKAAIPHDEAIRMILSGECGAFNPLLLSCLEAVDGQLREYAKYSPTDLDYQHESHLLAAEMLQQSALPYEGRAWRLLHIQQERADFFARQCGGIQFWFDRWTQTVILTDRRTPETQQHVLALAEGDRESLLYPADLARLRQAMAEATAECPEVSMQVRLAADGDPRRYRLTARAIYPEGDEGYACVAGQLTPLPEEN